MKVKVTFYEANEMLGGQKLKESMFLVVVGDDDREITLREASEGDESTLKDLTDYEEHADEIWSLLKAETGRCSERGES